MTSSPSPSPVPRPVPVPLLVAAALVALEGVALAGYGVAELFSVTGGRMVMAVTTAAFFLLYGGGLLVCAWALRRLHSWARAPIVLAQLIQVFVGWEFRGAFEAVAVALVAVAVAVLVGIFHPRSLAALSAQ